jgi:hypothetical protein
MPAADQALATCEAHLQASNAFNTEIEAYLVKYLLVLISSEFEEMIELLVEQRASQAGDPHLSSFVKSATGQLFRRLRVADIGGLLGRFHDSLKTTFQTGVNGTPAHAAFDTLINNRLQIAHTTNVVNLTFPELKLRYAESKDVLKHFASTLNLPSPF